MTGSTPAISASVPVQSVQDRYDHKLKEKARVDYELGVLAQELHEIWFERYTTQLATIKMKSVRPRFAVVSPSA